MKKIVVFVLSFLFGLSFSQDKKLMGNLDHIIMNLEPNVQQWMLVKNQEGKDKIIKNIGDIQNFEHQNKGIRLNLQDDDFYYIVYLDKGNIQYINSLEGLGTFIGKPNNVEELILKAVASGFFIDTEFLHLAGNYREDDQYYYVEMAKLTSKDCPIEKRNYRITFNKKTGDIVETEELKKYQEIYHKDCKNNPDRFIPPKKKKKKKVISIYG